MNSEITTAESILNEQLTIKAGDEFTAPIDGTYHINGAKVELKAGEVFKVKPIVDWPVGQGYFLKTQLFKVLEVGDKAVFMKREGQKDLVIDNVQPAKFFIGEHVNMGGQSWVMVHYFEPRDVYSFMPKDLWRAMKDKVKRGIMG